MSQMNILKKKRDFINLQNCFLNQRFQSEESRKRRKTMRKKKEERALGRARLINH